MTRGRVQFEPTITLGHIVQGVVLMVGALLFVLEIKGDQAVQAERIRANAERIAATEARTAAALVDIRGDIREIRNHVVSYGGPGALD